jgi:predicted flap endonuclease-1-like 5' DNA nuclease
LVKLTEIEGLDENAALKLRHVGVRSANDLFDRGATPRDRQKLAAQTGIDLRLITSWIHQIDLQRIEGIGAGYASLLESAGVGTPRVLARRNPENLHQTLERVNEEEELVRRLPSKTQVSGWVSQASSLGGDIGIDDIP